MCKKKRFDIIGAKLAISGALNSVKKNRLETRYYYCRKCKSYHLTKQEKN